MRISQIREEETVTDALDRVIDTARNENLDPSAVRLWPERVNELEEELVKTLRGADSMQVRKYHGLSVEGDAHVPKDAMRLAFGSTDEVRRWSYLEREARNE